MFLCHFFKRVQVSEFTYTFFGNNVPVVHSALKYYTYWFIMFVIIKMFDTNIAIS